MLSLPDAIFAAALVIAIAVSAWIMSRRRNFSPYSPFPPLPPLPDEAYPVESSGIPVNLDTSLDVGSRVLASWEGTWYRAEVIKLLPNDQVRIHYVGWENAWDTNVSQTALQLDISESAKD